ncbi:glycosyl transferase [Leptotrichia sp. OH3620_COT-345]|uniref:glycosyltransferase n=1 Tax=Leptotrichia sp. OH3620_COT-345 TaxID=2491048 RepID=UPI000F649A5A|nr:glycosyltransferase [Leptotrichia sp. OH3620_COT-345]RRD39548.1 glycosyl transferase [Leptotrichia sp. OH3620_COT-345]
MNGLKKIKISAVSPPFSGHLYPLMELLLPLLNSGMYEITVYTGMQKEKAVTDTGLNCKIILKDKPSALENIANTLKQTNMLTMYKQFRDNIKMIPQIMNELEEEFKKDRPDIVIADFVAIPAGLVCNKMKIPWITSIPTVFAIENKTTTPGYLGGLYPRKGFLYQIRDAIGRFAVRSAKKILAFLAVKKLKLNNFKLYNEKNEETIFSPYSILGLGMKELEFRDDFPEHFVWAGYPVPTFDKNIYPLIDVSNFRKTVFVTNGTHVLWGKKGLVEIVKKLSNIYPDICFIVSLGDYGNKEKEIKKVYENMFIYHYIDYAVIFPKSDYIIHHGGTGVLYNCIKYNKPSVVIPHDYDQFDYAVRIILSDVGIIANLKSEKSVIKAVEKMLNRSEWKNLEKIHNKFEEYPYDKILKDEIRRILQV